MHQLPPSESHGTPLPPRTSSGVSALVESERFLIHGFMESTTYHPSLNITLIPKVPLCHPPATQGEAQLASKVVQRLEEAVTGAVGGSRGARGAIGGALYPSFCLLLGLVINIHGTL